MRSRCGEWRKFFLKSRPISCASIIHVAIDSRMVFSVCEEGTASEEDENAFASVLNEGDLRVLRHLKLPVQVSVLGVCFHQTAMLQSMSVALLGGHQHEIIVWNWQTRKIIKHIPIPDASDRSSG